MKKMKSSLALTATCLLGTLICAQQPPAGPPKIAVLIITGQNSHNWKNSTPALRKVLEDTGRFDVRVTEEFRGASAETLAPYSVAIVNYSDPRGDRTLRWGAKTDEAVLDFVRSGKGLVIYHWAVAAFDGWTEYEKLSGGSWRPNNGHHSARHDFVVEIKDPEHPITKGLNASFPQTNDELYANLRWQPAGSLHVLATAYDDHALYQTTRRTDANAPQPLEGPGADEPMFWTVDYGQGRVFDTVMGHDDTNIVTPAFATMLARGTEWAATGKVTLPIPAGMAK